MFEVLQESFEVTIAWRSTHHRHVFNTTTWGKACKIHNVVIQITYKVTTHLLESLLGFF